MRTMRTPRAPRRLPVPRLASPKVAAGALLALSVWGFACPPDASRPDADTLTARQRDSILGESSLPGARGVGGALRAADSAAARARRADSIGGVP